MSDASDLAITLHDALIAGIDFDISVPDFSGPEFQAPDKTGPLYDAIEKISPDDLTVGEDSVTGDGMFDRLMKAYHSHLRKEYDANRISGQEYTKAYIALTEAAMSNATQFLLAREQSHWQAVGAQITARIAEVQSVTARVELESAKMRLEVVRIEALTQQVTFALNKIRLANEDIEYRSSVFNLEEILPKNVLMLDAQRAQVEKQTELTQTEVDLGAQKLALLTKQVAGQEAQNNLTLKQIENLQGEIDLFPIKEDLLSEQLEVQRAQTLDTRSDGTTPITGSVGKQKELYSQQITSYQRDAEIKASKLFTDAWVTMKTLDEGLAPPTQYSNANLDDILSTIATNNGLVIAP